MKNKMKFNYGDQVSIRRNAPLKYKPGKIGSIFSITEISNPDLEELYSYNIGTIIYGIEYIDGSDAEVPEQFLEMDMPCGDSKIG